MDSCSSKISVHEGMGTTQDDRFLAALNPASFLVDERKEIDFINIVEKLSHLIRYYNDANREDGDWSRFFNMESTSILVQIYLWDVITIQNGLRSVMAEVKISVDINVQKELLKEYFCNIKKQFTELNHKAGTIDNAIPTKEFLTATAGYTIEKADFIINEIKSSTDIPSLITNNRFGKNIQQLFGMLFNWKESCKDSIISQLENYAGHTPHYALFLAFLKLFKVAQGQLNEFTQKHLDLYYKEILWLKPAKAVPDYVHLLVEPSTVNSIFSVPKDTVFLAGKDSKGQNKYYASTADQAINNAKLSYFLTSYRDIATTPPTWKQADLMSLNGTATPFNAFKTNATDVETGLLVATPLFYLSGGERLIRLKINGSEINYQNYRFYLTGEKAVINVTDLKTIGKDKYLLTPPTQKKIIGYNPEIHKEIKVNTTYPVLKIVPKTNVPAIHLHSITIDIQVNNFTNFVLGTDTGLTDATKPFKPFGDFPSKGNGFVIGSNEFFIKRNALLNFTITPSISKKVKGVQHEHISDTDIFTVKQLKDGKWDNAKLDGNSYTNTNPIDEYKEPNKLPDSSSVSGYMKILTNNSAYEGDKFLEDYITECKKKAPNLPVAPVIQTISLDYTVSETFSFDKKEKASNTVNLYHILPFGYNTCSYNSSFPQQSPNGGDIFLGFENVVKGSGLSLLFQMAEGTANPRKEPATVAWQYLNNNTWHDFEPNSIGDETDELSHSGLVHITVPDYGTQSTILPASLFWVRIGVNITDAICNFIGIHERALKAILTDIDGNGSVFLENTAKETISKLREPISAVKKISQPYASFGGRKQDDDTLLYQRSSETLRHKKRAITSWDYERLVLKEFPEVYRVKCLNHYRYDAATVSNSSAGYITLIPIAKSANNFNPVSWRPLVSLGTMVKIKKYLDTIASPHARILVKAPMLEKIQLKFKVKYRDIPGADTRLYANMLIDTINQFLSPWAFDKQDTKFAATIEVSSLIQLIDNQKYVDYITDFEIKQAVMHDDAEETLNDFAYVKEIVPTSDYTLFIPHESHLIMVLTTDC